MPCLPGKEEFRSSLLVLVAQLTCQASYNLCQKRSAVLTITFSGINFIIAWVFSGMVAASTPLPVIGVPVRASTLDGVDSVLSILQVGYVILLFVISF